MKVFIDTNLVLDVLAERKPFYDTSRRIWGLIEKGELTGYLSASLITDIFYILKKYVGLNRAYETVNKLIMVFDVASVSETDIRKALSLALEDFEDALQLVCAKRIKADFFFNNRMRHK